MAALASTVPGKSSCSGHTPRTSNPTASSSRETSNTRSSPNLRASGAAGIENTAKHSTGVAASSAIVSDERCSVEASSGKTGGRLVIAPRRLNASARMPVTNSAGAQRWPPVRAWAGAGRTAGSDISGHVTALPRRPLIGPRPEVR